MSKPIKIVAVVVVIVDVFVKKKLGPKKFRSKGNPCPKTLGLKVLNHGSCQLVFVLLIKSKIQILSL